MSPNVDHREISNVVCGYSSWLERGWCRVEVNALALSQRNNLSPILVKGPEAPPLMISVPTGLSRTPGNGQFTCCARNHQVSYGGVLKIIPCDNAGSGPSHLLCSRKHQVRNGGVLKTIPCDRSSIGPVVWKMLRSKSENLRLRGETDESRLLRAFTLHFMQGLFCDEMAAPATSVNEFLHEYQMLDEEHCGRKSGITALLLSVIAGNAVVVDVLARQKPSDVTARTKCDYRSLSLTAGLTPLHLAVTFCATNHTQIVTILLEHGADPNAAFDKAGLPPLYCAAVTHNLAGLNALLECAGDRLQIEKGNRVISDTALGAAVFAGTPAIVESLLLANANTAHATDLGSSKLMSACENPSATPHMLTRLCGNGSNFDVNLCRSLKTFAWNLIFRCIEMLVWLKLATSEFLVDLAHSRGGTALHAAARQGHTPLAKWLLEHGARPSLRIKNAMGCTPLDISRVFGPFPETEAVLTRAVLEEQAVLPSALQHEPADLVTVGEPLHYPMYVLPVRTLLALSVLPTHEELLEQNKLVEWRSTVRPVFYVSLEQSTTNHPDPGGKRLDVLKRLLIRMVQGQAANVEADFASQAAFGKGRKISSANWRDLASDAHVWIGFCSAPTIPSASMLAAQRSLYGYIERATHFFALCPPTKYHNGSNRTCDFHSWCDRGVVRIELSALLMTCTPKPAVLITGDDSPMPAIDVSRFALSLLPGHGQFSCCERGHAYITDGGISTPILCQKPMARRVMKDLLQRRIEYHRHRGERDEMRLWRAFSPRFFQGLGVETPAITLGAFLHEFEFIHAGPGTSSAAEARESKNGDGPDMSSAAGTRDSKNEFEFIHDGPGTSSAAGARESKNGDGPVISSAAGARDSKNEFEFINDGSDTSSAAGVSPLFCAVLSGNVEVTRALARASPVDVTAQLKSDFQTLGLWAGCEPIHAAAGVCVSNHIQLIVVLLEEGADPNAAAGKIGITPLYAAAVMHNLDGILALVEASSDRLELEKKNRLVSDTALGGAAYLATPAIVDALLTASATAAHISDPGTTKLMLACENPAATPGMLVSLCRDGTIDICQRRRARTCFWALVLRLFEMAVWLHLLTSEFAMGMAHMRGGTALHVAARCGHTSLVRWLLEHGARPSLRAKNAMGATPLDIARVFGPYPETSALLVQAVMSAAFDEHHATLAPGG